MAMQSSNPAFRRMDGFNGRAPQGGQAYAGYGDPSTWSTGAGAPTTTDSGYGPTHTPVGTGDRMTIDSAVQKTAISLAVVLIAAGATWVLSGDPTQSDTAVASLYALAMVGALGGFVLSMVNSFKRVVSPPLVLAFAAFEGVLVGAISKVFATAFGGGVVTGAVLGTIAAFAGTLAAYKFFNIRVSDKFRKWVIGAMVGFVAVMLLNLVMSFFGADLGVRGFGPLGFVVSLIGLGLGVLMLILDFDFVERGIEAGLPERESWRAAFGLTVTLVWIYMEMLRIMAILRGD